MQCTSVVLLAAPDALQPRFSPPEAVDAPVTEPPPEWEVHDGRNCYNVPCARPLLSQPHRGSPESCKQLCHDTDGCAFVVYHERQKHCWLWSQDDDNESCPSFQGAACPSDDKYTTYFKTP